MKVKCYSVRLKSMTLISPNCFKAISFDGSESLIPSSQVFGADLEVEKSEAFFISAWILEKKNLQFSIKKEAWFDSETRQQLPSYTVNKHVPEPQKPTERSVDESLFR